MEGVDCIPVPIYIGAVSVIYKAYRTPFFSVRWLPENADVPYFGRLLGTCTDRKGGKYRLQPGADFADFLWAIPRAPWQLLNGLRQAEVEVTVPPCESAGRTEEVTKTFTVRGEKYEGVSGFLQEYVGLPLLSLGISLILILPLHFFANLVGTSIMGPVLTAVGLAPSAAALTLLGGLLIGALVILVALLIRLLYWHSQTEQGNVSYR
ncbi:MAG: hypothetical protein LBF24_01955 [Puniceicoccales bacterium]|jgi:hypothetical protein|nr:hypothetical protein [Puniceicoccales bacterium]